MNEGMEHAKRIASKIRKSGADKPKVVYCSPFLRTAHTAQLIALDLPNPTVRVEEGLTEWQIPSLLEDKEGRYVGPLFYLILPCGFIALPAWSCLCPLAGTLTFLRPSLSLSLSLSLFL